MDPPVHFLDVLFHLSNTPLHHILDPSLHFSLCLIHDRVHSLLKGLLDHRASLHQRYLNVLSRLIEKALTSAQETLLQMLQHHRALVGRYSNVASNRRYLVLQNTRLLRLTPVQQSDLTLQSRRFTFQHRLEPLLKFSTALLLVIEEQVIGYLDTQMSHAYP
jgi:hypothetical protein